MFYAEQICILYYIKVDQNFNEEASIK